MSKYLKEVKDNWGENILTRRNRKYKSPEMEECLAHFKKVIKAHMAGK